MKARPFTIRKWAALALASASLLQANEISSHQRMVDRLAGIEKETLENNYFLGEKWIRQTRAAFEALPENATTAERFGALYALAEEELNQGLERESIAHFEEAMALVDHGRNLNGVPQNLVINVISQLTVAAFRLAEKENCCAQPNPESCIYPLSPAAQHKNQEGSRTAIFYLEQFLGKLKLPEDIYGQSIWLLNLAYMTLGEHPDKVPSKWLLSLPSEGTLPPAVLPDQASRPFPPFRNIAEAAGVNTYSHAGGAVADDFNSDGSIDLLVSSWDPAVSAFLLVNDGTGKFSRQEAGLDGIKGGLNLKQADYDNDGDLDILVLRGAWLQQNGQHPNSLLQNDGTGKFIDVTYDVGLAEPAFPTQTAEWFDYDLDGDLDLIIGNESHSGFDAPAQLFRNENGHFIDVAEEAGIAATRYIKGVAWGDFNGDRYPDLFFSCLNESNLLFQNRGDGTFEDVTYLLSTGKAGPIRSFPAWFFDYDNDGWLDLFVSSYSCNGDDYRTYFSGNPLPDDHIPALFQNRNGVSFVNVARSAGLARPTLPMGSNFGDLTNNGQPDIYLGTGNPGYDSIVPNMLFINGEGKFYDFTMSSRMGHLQKGHAVSFADFDRDGDLDIFEQMGGALRGDTYFDSLFENPGFGQNWISVRLKGTRSNSRGVGARVRVVLSDDGGKERSLYQWMSSGGSFGANPLELHFGLQKAPTISRIEVSWPVTGHTQIVKGPPINQQILIVEEVPD
ncbi:MAG: CRTAC1 family protein [Verrucomicrobiales bacterium]|nr:CRTAC1 family protein [Verrucomicrobiales bacterium]